MDRNVFRQPTVRLIYNRYKLGSDTRPAVIEICISYNRKQKYMSTGIFVRPKEWKNGQVTARPDMLQLNLHLQKMVEEVREVLYEMSVKGSIDIFDIQRLLNNRRKSKTDFASYIAERAKVRMHGLALDTQKRYLRANAAITSWGGIRTFEDVIDKNIIAFDKWLDGKDLKQCSKWQNYHLYLNGYISDAIREGYLTRNPYEWLSIDKDKVSHAIDKYLTPEEFKAIRDTEMPTECLSRVRDVFVFQTYTCMAYKDLNAYNPKNIHKMNGRMVYLQDRKKTKEPYVIPLVKPALKVLEKYNDKLPVISNTNYNIYLKMVAQAAGVDKNISCHWARHTGATLLINEEGVELKIVSKILGHASIKITEQVYAKLLNQTIIEAIAQMERRNTKKKHGNKQGKKNKT